MVRTTDHEASLLCGILQFPQIHVPPSIPYSLTPSAYIPPQCDQPTSTPTQNRQHYSCVQFNIHIFNKKVVYNSNENAHPLHCLK